MRTLRAIGELLVMAAIAIFATAVLSVAAAIVHRKHWVQIWVDDLWPW